MYAFNVKTLSFFCCFQSEPRLRPARNVLRIVSRSATRTYRTGCSSRQKTKKPNEINRTRRRPRFDVPLVADPRSSENRCLRVQETKKTAFAPLRSSGAPVGCVLVEFLFHSHDHRLVPARTGRAWTTRQSEQTDGRHGDFARSLRHRSGEYVLVTRYFTKRKKNNK